MDLQMRRTRSVQIQDRENIYVSKGKNNVALPTKRHGLGVRGVLGEVNSNGQIDNVRTGKVANATAEFEKKATLTRNNSVRCAYNHVQSKVDTGRLGKTVQPQARPPLRREESTAGHAIRAAARSRLVLKEVQNVRNNDTKENCKKEIKKTTKLPACKEITRTLEKKDVTTKATSQDETDNALKPIIKDQTEILEKLSIAEKCSQKHVCLPEDIEDIDANDNMNPLLMSVYIKDIYMYLIHLEDKYAIEKNHLKNQAVITGRMRATLIDWLIEVQHQFSLLQETFQLTVGIIDRYLQATPNLPRNQLQLVGVTAMFIASKYEEVFAPSVKDFVYITDRAYTMADVFQCERNILQKLQFCLGRPIPLNFLRRFTKAAKGTAKTHHLSKYLVDLCLLEYSMAHYKPSELAASAVCLSFYLLTNNELKDVWTPTLVYYTSYTFSHIEPIIKKMASVVSNVASSKYQTVTKKYQDVSLAKVASLPQLKGEAIKKLLD